MNKNAEDYILAEFGALSKADVIHMIKRLRELHCELCGSHSNDGCTVRCPKLKLSDDMKQKKLYRVIYDGALDDLEDELNALAAAGYQLHSTVPGFCKRNGEVRNPAMIMRLLNEQKALVLHALTAEISRGTELKLEAELADNAILRTPLPEDLK